MRLNFDDDLDNKKPPVQRFVLPKLTPMFRFCKIADDNILVWTSQQSFFVTTVPDIVNTKKYKHDADDSEVNILVDDSVPIETSACEQYLFKGYQQSTPLTDLGVDNLANFLNTPMTSTFYEDYCILVLQQNDDDEAVVLLVNKHHTNTKSPILLKRQHAMDTITYWQQSSFYSCSVDSTHSASSPCCIVSDFRAVPLNNVQNNLWRYVCFGENEKGTNDLYMLEVKDKRYICWTKLTDFASEDFDNNIQRRFVSNDTYVSFRLNTYKEPTERVGYELVSITTIDWNQLTHLPYGHAFR